MDNISSNCNSITFTEDASLNLVALIAVINMRSIPEIFEIVELVINMRSIPEIFKIVELCICYGQLKQSLVSTHEIMVFKTEVERG